MQISFAFDSPAILCIKPGQKAFIYYYNGLSKAAFQAIQVGRALISVIKLLPPADLPVQAVFLYIDSSLRECLRVMSFLK